jgi:predicted CXXCH cytochrome family protein
MNGLSMNSFHFQSAKIISMKRLKLIFSVLSMVIVVAGSVSAENKHECSYCHITMHADAAMLLKTSLSGLCLECHSGRSGSNEHRIDIAPSVEAVGLPLSKDGKITCATCHDPHEKSEYPMLLRVKPSELCFKCHL